LARWRRAGLSGFDLEIFDPLISCHAVPENDNSAMDMVIKRFGKIAACGRSVELVHHPRKPSGGETGIADARGASAVVTGARAVRVCNWMTAAEAARAGIADHRGYFRADNGKANYSAPSTTATWFRHQGVLVPNGDDVGVVQPWHFPGAFDGVTTDHMHRVRELTRDGEYRSDPRAAGWIGSVVADVLGLDIEAEGDRMRIKEVLKGWYAKGVLAKVERRGTGADRHVFDITGESDRASPPGTIPATARGRPRRRLCEFDSESLAGRSRRRACKLRRESGFRPSHIYRSTTRRPT
jgi:hypothetical protein